MIFEVMERAMHLYEISSGRLHNLFILLSFETYRVVVSQDTEDMEHATRKIFQEYVGLGIRSLHL